MVSALTTPRLSFDEFLELEAKSSLKHEFVRGELFAMAGTTRVHNDIAGEVFSALKAHLKGKPCRAYMADVLTHVEAADASYYPDVVVTCSERDLGAGGDPRRLFAPTLIVEVLSESTAAFDLTEKFADYRLLVSLQEYAVIDSRSQSAAVYRREPDGWKLLPVSPGETLEFASIGFSIPLSAVYDGTDVPRRSRRPLRSVDVP